MLLGQKCVSSMYHSYFVFWPFIVAQTSSHTYTLSNGWLRVHLIQFWAWSLQLWGVTWSLQLELPTRCFQTELFHKGYKLFHRRLYYNCRRKGSQIQDKTSTVLRERSIYPRVGFFFFLFWIQDICILRVQFWVKIHSLFSHCFIPLTLPLRFPCWLQLPFFPLHLASYPSVNTLKHFSTVVTSQRQTYGWPKYRQGQCILHLITRWPEPLQRIVYSSGSPLALFSSLLIHSSLSLEVNLHEYLLIFCLHAEKSPQLLLSPVSFRRYSVT